MSDRTRSILIYVAFGVLVPGPLVALMIVASNCSPHLVTDALWPAVGVSLGLIGVFVLVMENIVTRYGTDHNMFFATLIGLFLFSVGIVLMFIIWWLVPSLEQFSLLLMGFPQIACVYRFVHVAYIASLLIGATILAITAVVCVRHDGRGNW